MANLIIFPKGRGRKEISLKRVSRIHIGRSKSNDIVVSRRMASRKHAYIESRDGRYFLVDAGSFNGTFLNRKRVKESLLKNKDIIQIAGRVFVFTDEAATVTEEFAAERAAERDARDETLQASKKKYRPAPESEKSARDTEETAPDLGFDFSLTPEDILSFQNQVRDE